MKAENIEIQRGREYNYSVEDSSGNWHFWRAAWQDAFNKRVMFVQIEHCGDYKHLKTALCITRCKASNPLVTTMGPLYDIPDAVIRLIVADVLKHIVNN